MISYVRRMALCAFAVLALAAFAAAEDYQIQLHRPGKPGDRCRVARAIEFHQSTVMKSEGQEMKRESKRYTVDFEAEVTILDVNKSGGTTSESCKIIKCVKTEGDLQDRILDPGDMLTATLAGKETLFRRNGADVSRDTAEILSKCITLSKTEATDDDVYGTSERKKIGDSWPVNAEVMAREFREEHPVKKENISGQIMLTGVTEVGGVKCLEIKGENTVTGITLPEVSNVNVQECNSHLTFEGKYPLDTSMPVLESKGLLSFEIVLSARQGPKAPLVTVSTDSRTARTETLTPMPRADIESTEAKVSQ